MARKGGAQGEWGWTDVAQYLIGHGHSRADVYEMTFAQIRRFSRAAERDYRRRLRDQAINLRAAQYDKGNWKKYLKTFDE